MPPFRRFPSRVVLLLALLLPCLASCSRSSDPGAAREVVPVRTARVERRDLPRVRRAVGTVQSVRSVALRSQVDGVVRAVRFREGDTVAAGDLLVSLDSRPYQNALAIARADLATAKAEASKAATDLERYEKLNRTENITQEQFNLYLTKRDTTLAQVSAREAAVANAELHLGYCDIRAPFAGRTGQIRLREGALVTANDASTSLLTLHQITPIEVAFSVPEGEIGTLRAALAAHPVPVRVVRTPDEGGNREGLLSFIDNAVDASTGTLMLKAAFPNTDQALWPGQFVEVEIEIGSNAGAITVPASAIQYGQRGDQVFVVRPDSTVELRHVKVARSFDGTVVIAEGLREGETVVTDGQLRLVPGARVVIRPPGDAQAPTAAVRRES